MKFALRVLIILNFLLFCTINAQNEKKRDSLLSAYRSQAQDSQKVKTAHAIYNFYYDHNPKGALQYSKEGLALAQKIDYKKGIATSYNHIGNDFMRARQRDSASFYFNKSLNLFKTLNDKHQAGLVTYNLIQLLYVSADYASAQEKISKTLKEYEQPVDSFIIMRLHLVSSKVDMRQTNYESGFESALKALAIAEALQLEDEKIRAKSSLASLYHYTGNKEKSIEIKKELLDIYRKRNNKKRIGLSLNDLGNSNYGIENYNVALDYLTESLSYSKEVNNHSLIGITLFNIGKTHVRLGQVQKGIDYLKQSIDYSRNISKHPLSESWALKRLGDVYTEELRMPEKAIPYLNRAIQLADAVGNKDDLYQSYRDRSEAYAALGQYKKAYADQKLYKSINDSVYNIEKSREIERLKTEFETKEKEQQIAIQENEIELLEEKEKVSALQKSLLGGGLLLSLALVGFGFYGFRQKIERNKLEKEKVDAELDYKKKELTTHALHLAKKNEVLESLKLKAQRLKDSESATNGYQQLITTINFDLKDDNNWENFSKYFQEVHHDFNYKVKQKFPDVTSNELRLMSLLKMNLSSKEIANILNISQEGIKKARYRLRKKLNITSEDSLQDLVLSL